MSPRQGTTEAIRSGQQIVAWITAQQEASRTPLNRHWSADLKAQTAAARKD